MKGEKERMSVVILNNTFTFGFMWKGVVYGVSVDLTDEDFLNEINIVFGDVLRDLQQIQKFGKFDDTRYL